MAGHYINTVEDKITGKPVNGATILVYNDGATITGDEVTSGTLATIFSDDGISQIDQSSDPISTGSDGEFDFYTNQPRVVVAVLVGGEGKAVWNDIDLVGSGVSSDITALAVRLDNHDALFGTAANATNLGTFTGATITDNVNTKTALQELETAVEGSGDLLSTNNLSDVANATTALSNLGVSVFGATLVDDVDATAARVTLAAATTPQTDEAIAGFIASPSDKDYRIVVKIPHGGTITETTTVSASGTCTATFKINTTALGGTVNSVSSTEQSQAHASANAFAADDDIVLTVSANASCVDLSFSIKYTRTLA